MPAYSTSEELYNAILAALQEGDTSKEAMATELTKVFENFAQSIKTTDANPTYGGIWGNKTSWAP